MTTKKFDRLKIYIKQFEQNMKKLRSRYKMYVHFFNVDKAIL